MNLAQLAEEAAGVAGFASEGAVERLNALATEGDGPVDAVDESDVAQFPVLEEGEGA